MTQMTLILVVFCMWIAIVVDPVRNSLVVNEVLFLLLVPTTPSSVRAVMDHG